ncbi:hypothetical protein AXF42_Ash009309 [Apostasia shenzhenica]|uniref:Uncharacterized protein n=1 Tax=Apostasia shenzhenica TaxID=1088818 RepID=A0A2I0B3Q0_9ASPA|nr:hypothetical protein AXF42_Ash009309 [Apostasia shenzhenica]
MSTTRTTTALAARTLTFNHARLTEELEERRRGKRRWRVPWRLLRKQRSPEGTSMEAECSRDGMRSWRAFQKRWSVWNSASRGRKLDH